MAEGTKGTRLSRIARDLGVGVSTIVEFLNKKGLDIDTNPNNKVPAEFYDLLLKEYKSDSEIKKESDRLIQSSRVRKETITLDEESEHEIVENIQEEPEAEEAVIEESAPVADEPEAKVSPEKEPEEEKEKPGLKILGKVDVDGLKKGKKSAKKKEEPVVAEELVVPEESPATEADTVVEEAVVEEVVVEEPAPVEETVVAEGIVEADESKETEPVVEEPVEEKVTEVVAEVTEEATEEAEEPAIETDSKPETKTEIETEIKEEVVAEETESPENETTPEEGDDSEVKVIGKIDLNTINQRTRPAKKSKKQREAERQDKMKARKDAQEEWRKKVMGVDDVEGEAPQSQTQASGEGEKSEDEKDQFVKTKFTKLSGPTVVGKIDLPVEEKKTPKQKKPVASSSDDANKKRRKRIQKERVNPFKKGAGAADAKDQKGRKPKPGAKKKPIKAEITDEDVQKQIKDTLARLTTKGKTKASKHRRQKRDDVRQKQQEEIEREEQEKSVLKVNEFVSVNELASMMNVPATNIIATCMSLGMFVSINQRLDAETMTIVADEFGYSVEFISIDEEEVIVEAEEAAEDLKPRPPIVTVMGHVDHGKTSLLDHIREANVIAGEAGGITQHIGAYSVNLKDGRVITFLDTPGHEAFTAMRARGAKVTDIAIIVVAADDNIMPQTIEAINHAQAAGVPIVFAINKIDKPGANPEKIKEGLANMNMLVEEWGGKYQSQDISAKNGTKVEELLEKVLLEAEMLELQSNPDKNSMGTIIESSLDKGRGYVATILVQSGTLRIGDIILAGPHYGHVKAMFNERGKKIKEAGPSTPVLILGLNGAPQAGDKFNILDSEREAREIANKREQLIREQGLRTKKHITLDEIGRRIAIGNFQELNIIVKGDVDGSVEALADSLIKLSTEEIEVNVKHKAVGQISESDVLLAAASDAIIIGFQVRPSMGARKLAEKEEIDIRLYSIIYDAINEMKAAMEGMLSPDIKEEIVATLEIREVFKITKVGTIAGCIVKEGKIHRNTRVRIIRDGIVVYTGELGSLKRFKDDVKEVGNGYECGLNIEKFNDVKVGDIIEGYKEVEVERTL
jgi:translation initiation factor IF-2